MILLEHNSPKTLLINHLTALHLLLHDLAQRIHHRTPPHLLGLRAHSLLLLPLGTLQCLLEGVLCDAGAEVGVEVL